VSVLGLPYKDAAEANYLQGAPRKNLPFIEEQGKVIADSYFIIEYIKDTYKVDIDDHLSSEQRGLCHLLTKSLDENLYWCLVYSRWLRDDTWPLVKNTFFGKLPVPLKYIVPVLVRNRVKKSLIAHGMGRHDNGEIMQIFEHSLRSLSNVLGTKAYFLGEKPSTFDAAAFGLLAELILVDFDNPFNRLARTYGNLADFCQRFKTQYYGTAVNKTQIAA